MTISNVKSTAGEGDPPPPHQNPIVGRRLTEIVKIKHRAESGERRKEKMGGWGGRTDCRLIPETENKTNANITQICVQSERKILQLLRLIRTTPEQPPAPAEGPPKKPRVCAKKQSQMESVQGANNNQQPTTPATTSTTTQS